VAGVSPPLAVPDALLGGAGRARPGWLVVPGVPVGGSVLLVPIVEELFWRAWLMRWLVSHKFYELPLGYYAAQAFWVSALLFASEHGIYWDAGWPPAWPTTGGWCAQEPGRLHPGPRGHQRLPGRLRPAGRPLGVLAVGYATSQAPAEGLQRRSAGRFRSGLVGFADARFEGRHRLRRHQVHGAAAEAAAGHARSEYAGRQRGIHQEVQLLAN